MDNVVVLDVSGVIGVFSLSLQKLQCKGEITSNSKFVQVDSQRGAATCHHLSSNQSSVQKAEDVEGEQ